MLIDNVHGDEVKLSYKEVNEKIIIAAAAMQKLGVVPGDCVSIFAENSHRWFIVEQSIMKAGGCNAVRGALAPVEELNYIFDNSKSVGIVVESDALLKQLCLSESKAPQIKNAKFAIVLFPQDSSGEDVAKSLESPVALKVLTFEELLQSATASEYKNVVRDGSSTATLVYTSGTTSKPKGAGQH